MGDGTGASGTWGISVSGGAQYIPYDSNKYCDTVEKLDAMIDGKLQYTAISAGAIPSINNDGLVISVGSSTDWGAQIWVDDGASGVGMAIRSRKYGGWNNWYNVLTEANYVSYCSSKFVPLTGGTMTGKLTV